jgi:Protein of unknown function (DUF2911)
MNLVKRLSFLFLYLLLLTACGNGDAGKKINPVDSVNTADNKGAPGENKKEPVNTTNPYASIDKSPMDMIYFPVDYPKLKMSHTTNIPPVARIIYSRPHREGRKIFGELLKYGEPWRLGANEATEIELHRDVTIQNKKVAKGRYILYCIPYENKWTIVFNSNVDSWGLKMDSRDDVYKFDVPLTFNSSLLIEYFTIAFEKTDKGFDMLMVWENMTARLPITL